MKTKEFSITADEVEIESQDRLMLASYYAVVISKISAI